MGRGRRRLTRGNADLYIGCLPGSPATARYCVVQGGNADFGRSDVNGAVLEGSAVVAEYRSADDLLWGMYLALIESPDAPAARQQARRLEELFLDAVRPCTLADALTVIEEVDGVPVVTAAHARLRPSALAAESKWRPSAGETLNDRAARHRRARRS